MKSLVGRRCGYPSRKEFHKFIDKVSALSAAKSLQFKDWEEKLREKKAGPTTWST